MALQQIDRGIIITISVQVLGKMTLFPMYIYELTMLTLVYNIVCFFSIIKQKKITFLIEVRDYSRMLSRAQSVEGTQRAGSSWDKRLYG